MYKLNRTKENLVPDDISFSSFGIRRVNAGEPLDTGRSSNLSTTPYRQEVIEKVISVLSERRGTMGDPLKGFDVYDSGDMPDPVPFDLYEYKSTHSNGSAWRKRKKTGNIVMGPYERMTIIQRIVPGELLVASQSASRVTTNWKLFDAFTVIGDRVFLDVERRLFMSGGFTFPRTLDSLEPFYPADAGWDYTADRIGRDLFKAEFKYDTGLCTSALAEANKGSMDLLTTAAELPETMKMIFDGISSIGALFKATKNRELVLSKGYKERIIAIKQRYADKLKEINVKRKGANKYKKTLLDREAEQLQRAQGKALEKEALAFTDAVAGVWMTWRYGIMPNVYSIDDGLNLLANWFTDYVTTRDKDVISDLIFRVPSGFTGKDTWDSTHRITVKRKYVLDGNISSRLMQVGSANLAVTALELVKKSFVLGWFINLGDLLSAYTAVPVHSQQACSYARKVSLTETYHGPNGCKVNLVVNAYKRDIINPLDYSGLVFDPLITLYRAFDSAAMLWPAVKKNLIPKGK